MIKYLRNVLIFTLGLAVFLAVHAATPPIAQAEINYLLEFVESSGCEFSQWDLVRFEKGANAPSIEVRSTRGEGPDQDRRGVHREGRHA
jgi:hypothetical protein